MTTWRCERMLRLLLGLRDRSIMAALYPCGFTEEELREGWRLLAKVASRPRGLPLTSSGSDGGSAGNDIDLATEIRQMAEATDAMWAYYEEWSAIAGAVIKDDTQLTQLGIAPTGSPVNGGYPSFADDAPYVDFLQDDCFGIGGADLHLDG